MRRIVSELGSELVELIYPVPCIGCGVFAVGPLCDACAAQIGADERTGESIRIRDYAGNNHSIEVKAAGIYEGALKKMILELKASFSVYSGPLARLMMVGAGNDPRYLTADQVYYVPSTRKKIRERGYNPAQLLARHVSSHLGIPLVDALAKTRYMDDQDSLTEKERWSNVEMGFRVSEQFAPGGRGILVDDVLTTGATAVNCARALLSSGVRDLAVLVAGRALLRERRII